MASDVSDYDINLAIGHKAMHVTVVRELSQDHYVQD